MKKAGRTRRKDPGPRPARQVALQEPATREPDRRNERERWLDYLRFARNATSRLDRDFQSVLVATLLLDDPSRGSACCDIGIVNLKKHRDRVSNCFRRGGQIVAVSNRTRSDASHGHDKRRLKLAFVDPGGSQQQKRQLLLLLRASVTRGPMVATVKL